MPSSPDVLIVGDGIVALTIALALSRRGIRARVIGAPRAGRASTAAAGLLAPSVGSAPAAAQAFAIAARDFWPGFVERLADASGRPVPFGPRGILQIARTATQLEELRSQTSAESMLLDARIVVEMEPALAPVAGALFHPADGVVDTLAVDAALGAAVERDGRVERVRAEVTRVEIQDGGAAEQTGAAAAHTADGAVHRAPTLVLAGGAWSARLAGLPRTLPVEPVRGQMLAFDRGALNHAVMGPGGYLVPRGERTIVGSTLEHVGFDAGTTTPALDQLAELARAFAPSVGRSPRRPGWSGLRPVTPDMQPILGRDPDHQRLVYACGHSKNGILTAPMGAECVAALIVGETPPHDVSHLAVDRFAAA